MTVLLIGDALPRVEGMDKATGRARYAAEHAPAGLTYAAFRVSPIARGALVHGDPDPAVAIPGVLAVLVTGDPSLRLTPLTPPLPTVPLQGGAIRFAGQPLAIAVATTQEVATLAAEAIRLDLRTEPHRVDVDLSPGEGDVPEAVVFQPADARRGDPEAAWAAAPVQVEHCYQTAANSHNPIEPQAVVAEWAPNGAGLTIHCSTQGVVRVRDALAEALGLPTERVEVLSAHTGGGFGSKLRCIIPLCLATACAARAVGRPVRLELTRTQMFALAGHRQPTHQRVALGADRSGRLQVVLHDVAARDAHARRYSDPHAFLTRMLYATPNLRVTHRTVAADVGEPQEMRAPGEATGSFALECAMDELAWELGIDPVELRRCNHAEADTHAGLPFSSKSLLKCTDLAAERFGWHQRPSKPRAMQRGHTLIGWGMASAVYPVHRLPAVVQAALLPDGMVRLRCATQDIGTGTRTAMAQLAAAELGLPPGRVVMELGQASLPPAPPSVGSMTAASVAPAVSRAARALREKAEQAGGEHGHWTSAARDGAAIEVEVALDPTNVTAAWSSYSFGAVFAEVSVDQDLGEVRVSRLVAAYACGRVLNAALARSQALGGLTFGIGQALSEATVWDDATGRVLNADLGGYLVPVNLDVPADIEVHFIAEQDAADPLGVKTLGMMGAVGTAAAICNAVFHATGRRIRTLPITPEKVL